MQTRTEGNPWIRDVALFLAGFVIGALVAWLLLIGTLELGFSLGALLIPLFVTLTLAVLMWKKTPRKWLAAGIAAGAVVETAFFEYLFLTWG